MKVKIIYDNPELEDRLNYATKGSAGIDLRANVGKRGYDGTIIPAGECVKISSGIRIHIEDPNYVGIIVPRSGLGSKHGIILSNTIGIIDSDYQGEIGLTLWNRGKLDYTIQYLERVAQLLFVPVMQVELIQVSRFDIDTERNVGGFGSTGNK